MFTDIKVLKIRPTFSAIAAVIINSIKIRLLPASYVAKNVITIMAAMNTDVIAAEPSLDPVHQEQEVNENGEKIIIRGICVEGNLKWNICCGYSCFAGLLIPCGIYYGRMAPAIYYWIPEPFIIGSNLPIEHIAISDIADIQNFAADYMIKITLKKTHEHNYVCQFPICRYIYDCENGFAFVEAVRELMLKELQK